MVGSIAMGATGAWPVPGAGAPGTMPPRPKRKKLEQPPLKDWDFGDRKEG